MLHEGRLWHGSRSTYLASSMPADSSAPTPRRVRSTMRMSLGPCRRIVCAVFAFSVLALAGSCECGAPAALPVLQLQEMLDSMVGDDQVPGAILAVQSPEGTWVGAAGTANLATGAPMRPDMQVRLASITKSLTAILVLNLVDDKVLSLDDTVESWLPGRIPRGSEMTIGMLLSHRAGIFDHTELEAFWDSLIDDPRKTWTSEEILALVHDRIPTADFGSFAYSNTGYHLLGMIVEAATGSTVSDEIERRIFSPLGLGRTALRRDGQLEPPYAGGYTMIPPDSGIVSDTGDWNFSWDWTAGAGVSTGADMLGLASALFGGQILEPATLAQMVQPLDAGGYGLGIGSLTDTDTFHATLIGHSGQNPGTSTLWYYFPEYRTTIFVAVTRSDAATRPGQTVLVDGMSTAAGIFMQAWKILRGW